MKDSLLPFLIEGAGARGSVVNLDATWREVLSRRAYPPLVRNLLGEAMAAAALLCSTIKFDGALVLQAQASGREAPIRLLVVECRSDFRLRATAKLGESPPDAPMATMSSLLGEGKLVITIDPKGGQASYQGIVSLEGGHLGAALENYMARSEQLDTRIHLAADGRGAAGMLIQRVPAAAGTAAPDTDSNWQGAVALAHTITPAELLGLDQTEIVRRLFQQLDVRVFDARPTLFECTCSRERVAGMLRMLGHAEVDVIVAEQGRIAADCDFCNRAFTFDALDAARLFGAGRAGTAGAVH